VKIFSADQGRTPTISSKGVLHYAFFMTRFQCCLSEKQAACLYSRVDTLNEIMRRWLPFLKTSRLLTKTTRAGMKLGILVDQIC
jgi:hypothetical protein